MATETSKLKSRLAALTASLDELKDKLEPLLAQTLPESLLSLETIQQAKLQVALPYLVYDLVFVYLKTTGIDPKTHPVVAELDRVRQYFEKIKNAEDPAKRKTSVDKAAATRFIKHAITQLESNADEPQTQHAGPSHIRFDSNGEATTNVHVKVKVTSKMKERAQYEQELKDMGSEEEEEDLKMFDESNGDKPAESTESRVGEEDKSNESKSRGRNIQATTDSHSATKRRRPAIDPFGGYGSDGDGGGPGTKREKSTVEEKLASNSTSPSSRNAPEGRNNTIPRKDKKSSKKRKAKKASSEGQT